jgi:hypothetical protein
MHPRERCSPKRDALADSVTANAASEAGAFASPGRWIAGYPETKLRSLHLRTSVEPDPLQFL